MNDTKDKIPEPNTSQPDQTEEREEEPSKDETPKKSWDLAPRTGQRHANPFQRKTK